MAKIFVTDLDGTLLTREATLSETSRRLIMDLLDRGVHFTVASARSLDAIRLVLKDLPLRVPVIEFNGAYISDYHSGEKLLIQSIPGQFNEEIFKVFQRHGVQMAVTTHEGDLDYLTVDTKKAGPCLMNWINFRKSHGDGRIIDTPQVDRVLGQRIVVFNAIDEAKRIGKLHDELVEIFGSRLEIHQMKGTYDDCYWLNVASPLGTKGHALKILKEEFFNPGDVLYAFGDNENDVAMFEVADYPVALKNSIPRLKSLATEEIGYHYTDSVARYIWEAMEGDDDQKNR